MRGTTLRTDVLASLYRPGSGDVDEFELYFIPRIVFGSLPEGLALS